MHYYNLNFYEHGELIIYCYMQIDAPTARSAMQTFKATLKTSARHIDALAEIKEDYPEFTMKAERN